MNKGERWNKILGNPTLDRVAKQINRRFLWMSEEDILYIFDLFEKANKVLATKKREERV